MSINLATADFLKYAQLQMAAEAFVRARTSDVLLDQGADLQGALVAGNEHASRFTPTQADDFIKHWKAIDQAKNTGTGFSGTLFECTADDPATGAKKGEKVICFRSTEFIDDAARDNQATNVLEIKDFGFAFGQLRDMEEWYASLRRSGKVSDGQPLAVTGYSLGVQDGASWGLLIAGAAQDLVNDIWWPLATTVAAMFGLIYSLSVLGDWMRDAWDPRLRGVRG